MVKTESTGMLTVNPDQLQEILWGTYQKREPKLFIAGSPGCGKTSLVYDTFARHNVPVFVFQASLYDPVEIKGLPVFDTQKNLAKFVRFEEMPSQGEGVLFIDDLPHAPTQTQNTFMRLILEGIAGAWDLGGLFPITAGNRASDRAGAKDFQSALSNRLVYLTLQNSYEHWRKWAIKKGLAPEVIAFLGSPIGSGMLNTFDSSRQINATERSWEKASQSMQAVSSNTLRRLMIHGAIGDEAASKFIGWLKIYDKLPDLGDIMGGKKIYPKELDVMYAVATGLSTMLQAATPKERTKLYATMINYINDMPAGYVEMGVLMSKDMIVLDKDLFLNVADSKWATRYPNLLQ